MRFGKADDSSDQEMEEEREHPDLFTNKLKSK